MKLTGLHLLLTYQCNLECDHCFVWGSPWQSGTMTLQNVREILRQAKELGTVEWIYFEGGEPFLYYAVLVREVQEAAEMGFRVSIVTNSYWAISLEDALEWLNPFVGLVQDVAISSDLYHWSEKLSQQAKNARRWANLRQRLSSIRWRSVERCREARAVGRIFQRYALVAVKVCTHILPTGPGSSDGPQKQTTSFSFEQSSDRLRFSPGRCAGQRGALTRPTDRRSTRDVLAYVAKSRSGIFGGSKQASSVAGFPRRASGLGSAHRAPRISKAADRAFHGALALKRGQT